MKPEHKKYLIWGVVALAIMGVAGVIIYFGFFSKDDDATPEAPQKRRGGHDPVEGSGGHIDTMDGDSNDKGWFTEGDLENMTNNVEGNFRLLQIVKSGLLRLGLEAKEFFSMLGGIFTMPGQTAPQIVS